MKPVFADSSYYVALLSGRDAWHARTVELSKNLLGRIFTTEYVLVETASMLCKGVDRNAFVDLVRYLESDPSVQIVAASSILFRAGFDLFAARPDKEWSVVDSISFLVMKQRRLQEALTTDRHFVQAGFRALLREDKGP
jgi:predicted nucleic acid-binding protein